MLLGVATNFIRRLVPHNNAFASLRAAQAHLHNIQGRGGTGLRRRQQGVVLPGVARGSQSDVLSVRIRQ